MAVGVVLEWFWSGFHFMDAVGPKRKPAVKLKLQEHDWDPVKTFVETYFEQPDKSTKATYEVLLSEIKKVFPDFDISKRNSIRKLTTFGAKFDTKFEAS